MYYLNLFRKSREDSGFIETLQEKQVPYMKTRVFYDSFFPKSSYSEELFETNVVEKIETHVQQPCSE